MKGGLTLAEHKEQLFIVYMAMGNDWGIECQCEILSVAWVNQDYQYKLMPSSDSKFWLVLPLPVIDNTIIYQLKLWVV